MRFAILALTLVLALAVCVAASPSTTNIAPLKESAPVTPPPSKGPLQGGDTIATATLIAALPYDDTGTTVGFTHDYDEVCPYTGSLSPDVVYKYSPTVNQLIDIYTCNSAYDTKLFVYDNVYTPGVPLACNDDSSLCAGPAYRSYIQNLQVYAGHTYYIVVDGYGSASGAYEFHVRVYTPPPPCPPCPSYAIQEGEPTCYANYVDATNGGCNSTPPVFSNITFPKTVCGTSGTYMVGASTYRDTDWYQFTLTTGMTVQLSVCANFNVLIGFIDLTAGCPVSTFYASTTGVATVPVNLTSALYPGTWVAFVAPSAWTPATPCGTTYVMTLWDGITPVEPTTWGTLKAMYR